MQRLVFLFVLLMLFVYLIGVERSSCRVNDIVPGDYDGNGKYQYGGRGSEDEDVATLLQRIDWIAKNSTHSIYITSYLISFIILIATIFILMSQEYLLSLYEMILILASAYIVSFSILNLFAFHSDKYPNYYIRKNVEYLRKQLNLSPIENFLEKTTTEPLPHRTFVDDVLLR